MSKQKLQCKYDDVIEQLLQDSSYDVREDGTIWTRNDLSGAETENDWRLAGWNKRGYRWLKYKRIELTAHRIIYRKFKGPLNPFLFINHIDANPSNNHPSNLELVSVRENNLHTFKVFRENKKRFVRQRKINFEIAEQVRADKKLGLFHRELATKYQISKTLVSDIVNNKIWKKLD
jgi:hypothetical protein